MTRVTIRELESFLAVAECLNFSRAAERLHLSQAPLSRHIQSLEGKVGTRLLKRNTHVVVLTEHGRLYLEDARTILGHLDRAHQAIQRARQGEARRLRLAFIGSLLDEKLVSLIRQFRKQLPACQVEVADLPPAAQLEALTAEELDGGFIGAKPTGSSRNLAFQLWRRDPLVLAVPSAHVLARKKLLRWQELKNLSWVMVTDRAAPAFRQQFAELAEKHSLSPSIVQESDRLPAIITMVAAESGVTMMPQSVGRLVPTGIVIKNLPHPSPVLLSTFAYRPVGLSSEMTAFLKLLSNDCGTRLQRSCT
jgi:DNA-binding transcriptional LysR family regulator